MSLAIHASERVCAVAAGAAHPSRSARAPPRGAANGLEAWVDLWSVHRGLICADAPVMGHRSRRDCRWLNGDRPDMADALATSRVLILLFLGKQDPRYPLAVSFAEQAGARFIGLAGRGSATSVGTCRRSSRHPGLPRRAAGLRCGGAGAAGALVGILGVKAGQGAAVLKAR